MSSFELIDDIVLTLVGADAEVEEVIVRWEDSLTLSVQWQEAQCKKVHLAKVAKFKDGLGWRLISLDGKVGPR